MATHQEADRLIQQLLNELDDLRTELSRLKYDCKPIKEFQEDVQRLYDLLVCGTTDSPDSRIYLIEVLTKCLAVTRQIISENTKGLSEYKTLKAKLANLETMEEDMEKLYAGQLAFAVEDVIIGRVFKDSQIKESPLSRGITTISQLEKDICDYGTFTGEETRHIKQAWKDLKYELSFENKHFRCIKALKKVRVATAHPPFNKERMELAVEHLPDSVLPPCEKRNCPDLFKMYKKLS